MERKYELLTDQTKEFHNGTVYRIQALKDINDYIKKGDIGGWVSSENNLSHDGTCWIDNNAVVCEKARVKDNAYVYHNAMIYGHAIISGNAKVSGNANVHNFALVSENANVSDNAFLEDECHVHGNARVFGTPIIRDSANIYGNSAIFDVATIYENAIVEEFGSVKENARVHGNCRITGIASISGDADVKGGIIDDGDISTYAVIRSNNDYLSLLSVDYDLTAYRSSSDHIYINYTQYDDMRAIFKLEEFEKNIKKYKRKIRKEYMYIIKIIKNNLKK